VKVFILEQYCIVISLQHC